MQFRQLGSRRFSSGFAVNAAIVLFNLILLVAMWAAVLALVRLDREETIRAAIARNDNLAIALEQYAVRTIENADAIIRYLMREYTRSGGHVDLPQLVANYTIDSKTITGVVLADERGNAISTAYPSTPARWSNVADREHFKVHLASDSGKLIVGQAVIGRITGKPVIPLTRRINKPDGTFGGVAMAVIEPGRFTDVLHDAKLRPLDTISLVGLDGVTRARLRGTNATWGEHMGSGVLFAEQRARPVGHYYAKGQLDGVPRYFSYRTLSDYGVIAVVGAAEADVLAEFDRTRRVYLSSAGLTSAFILGFAALLMIALAAQRSAAAAVERSRARALATFEQAAVGIAHSDVDGRYLDVNQKLCQILGYTREELLARRFLDVTHPDELPSSSEYRRAILADGPDASPVEREKRYVRKDGSVVWCAITISTVYNAAGEIDYLLVVIKDISDRKRAERELQETEARFRSIFEQAGIGIAMVAIEDGRLLRVNPALADMFGYSVDELRHLTVADLSEREDYLKDMEMWQGLVESASGRFQVEKRYRRKDGSLMWGVLTTTVVRDAERSPLFLIGMLEDITDRKRAEDAVRDYSLRLRQLSRRLMALEEDERRRLGRELHDRAGANLSALLLSVAMLRRNLPHELLPTLEPRLDDAENLLRETVVLVRDVLADLRPTSIDELGLVPALKHHVQRLAGRSGMDIRVVGVDPPSRLPPAVEISLFRIAQEALNNATKHSEAKHITVALAADAARTVLTVADDGKGFDAAARAASSTSLGMLTMMERAEAIDARLTVRSAPGAGTAVIVEVDAAH